MGFGLLLIGYLATYLLSLAGGYGCYPAIVGCFFLLYALFKLSEYEKRFLYAFYAVMPITLCVLFKVIAEIVGMGGETLPLIFGTEMFSKAVSYIKFVSDVVFHVMLFLAVSKTAKDTELPKIRRTALSDLVIYGVYSVSALANLIFPTQRYIFMFAFIAMLLCTVLNSVMIGLCYMKIADENDADMKAKPSRFKFVNDFREEYDKREEKAQKRNRELFEESRQRQIKKFRDHNDQKKKNKK